jgi:alpha-1,3-rhamnosyl/mannosyltransferase
MITQTADHIVYISENSKQDFHKFCDDIGAVPPGGDVVLLASESRSISQIQPSGLNLDRFGINSRYILSVGTLEPRKNYWTLVHAFSRLDRDMDMQLVIVGRMGWGTNDLYTYVNNINQSRIKILTDVSDRFLEDLYQNAEAYFSASIAEGFNLPVLEAQQAGLQVVLSGIPTHLELFPSAEFVDVFDVSTWTKKIEQVAKGGLKKQVESISTKSWQLYASEVIQIAKKLGS